MIIFAYYLLAFEFVNGAYILLIPFYCCYTCRSTLWLVEFYLDWCEHCKEFAPIYKSIAKDIASTTTLKYMLHL